MGRLACKVRALQSSSCMQKQYSALLAAEHRVRVLASTSCRICSSSWSSRSLRLPSPVQHGEVLSQ